jgi:hypothetical protein
MPGSQADAEECYIALCDAFEQSQRLFSDAPQQYLVSDGLLCSQRTCAECRTVVQLSDQQFRDLHLTATKRTLRQALTFFTDSEPLEGVQCQKCGSQQIRKRSLLRNTQQPVLVIHFQRSVFNRVTGRTTKIQRPIDFPIVLDMEPFILPAPANSAMRDAKYQLKGVCVHHGPSVVGGHCTAFVEHEGQWFHCDDHTIKPVPVETVRQQQAYLLFYEKLLGKQNTANGQVKRAETPTLPTIPPREQMYIAAEVVKHVPAGGAVKGCTTLTSSPKVVADHLTWAEITARVKHRMIIGASSNRRVPPVQRITSQIDLQEPSLKVHLYH